MLTKSSICSGKGTATLTLVITVTTLLFFVTQFHCANGIPINAANNKNNYNENHANRQLPNQQPPPWERPPSLHQQQPFQQASQSQGPAVEDFGRLHTNKNHFQRHAIIPPPGAFHQNPSEPNVAAAGTNSRYNNFDESNQQQHPNLNFRSPQLSPMQPQMSSDEANDFHQRLFHRQNFHRNSQEAVQSPPPPQPSFSNRFDSTHREEDHHFNHIPNQSHQQMLNDNEIPRERMFHPQSRPNVERVNTFGQWQEQQPPPQPNKVSNEFMGFPGQSSVHGHRNNAQVPPSALPQLHPTAIAIVVPRVDGMSNSTLFIEYDISDNDITYETIVEIEDLPAVLESNYNTMGNYAL